MNWNGPRLVIGCLLQERPVIKLILNVGTMKNVFVLSADIPVDDSSKVRTFSVFD